MSYSIPGDGNNWVTPDNSVYSNTYPLYTNTSSRLPVVTKEIPSLRSSFNLNNAISGYENVPMSSENFITNVPPPSVYYANSKPAYTYPLSSTGVVGGTNNETGLPPYTYGSNPVGYSGKVIAPGDGERSYTEGEKKYIYSTPPIVHRREVISPPNTSRRYNNNVTTTNTSSTIFSNMKFGNSVLNALLEGKMMEEVQALVNLGNDLNLVGNEVEEFGSLVHFCLYMGIDDSLTIAILSHPWFRQVNRLCPQTGGTCLHVAAALGRKEVCYAILERFDFNQLITKDYIDKEAKEYCRKNKRKGQKIIHAIENHPLYKQLKEAENLLKARLTNMQVNMGMSERDLTSVMNVDPSSSILSMLVDPEVFGSKAEAAVQTSVVEDFKNVSSGSILKSGNLIKKNKSKGKYENSVDDKSSTTSMLSDKEILRRRQFLRNYYKEGGKSELNSTVHYLGGRLASGKSELNSTTDYLSGIRGKKVSTSSNKKNFPSYYDDLSSFNSSEESSIDFNLLRNATDDELLHILRGNLNGCKKTKYSSLMSPRNSASRHPNKSYEDPYSMLEAKFSEATTKRPEDKDIYTKSIVNIKPKDKKNSFVI